MNTLRNDIHPEPTEDTSKELFAGMEVPEGATVRPLLRGPSERFGSSPGGWVYTGAEVDGLEDTGYSMVDIPSDDSFGYTEVWNNETGEIVGAVENRKGVKGATLITETGESTSLTSTAALHELMGGVIGNDRE